MIHASAPGKLFITGEYAVLERAPAWLTAVDVRAHCRLEPGEGKDSRLHAVPVAVAPLTFRMTAEKLDWQGEGATLVDSAWQALPRERREKLARSAWNITLDTSAFFIKDRKLGLGSSAAALVALLGALWAASGGLPEHDEAFATARAAHEAWQGGGSGADLAVALAGGTLLYRRDPRVAAPVAIPPGLELVAAWSGEPASTGEFLRRLAAFEQRDPVAFRDCYSVVVKAAEHAALAASDGEPETFLEAFCACGNSLRALGEAADIPIWTERHERAGQLVRAAGGIYKPSGAGGGDVGIAVIPNRDAAGRNGVESALSSAGFTVLPLRYGARGLAVDPA